MTPNRIVAVLAAVAIALTAGCSNGDDDQADDADDSSAASRELTGIARDPAPEVGAIVLPDASAGGAELALRAEPGSLLLVYFGYTSCPDVCPTTMADIRAALADMSSDTAGRVGLAMTTIDPNRDTGELLTGYVQSFVPRAHALRSDDPAALRAAADAFGADYSVVTAASGEIEVSHTGHLYVVDDQGRLLLQWPFGTPPDDLRHDLEILLDRQDSA